jgi:hypothetical protein
MGRAPTVAAVLPLSSRTPTTATTLRERRRRPPRARVRNLPCGGRWRATCLQRKVVGNLPCSGRVAGNLPAAEGGGQLACSGKSWATYPGNLPNQPVCGGGGDRVMRMGALRPAEHRPRHPKIPRIQAHDAKVGREEAKDRTSSTQYCPWA